MPKHLPIAEKITCIICLRTYTLVARQSQWDAYYAGGFVHPRDAFWDWPEDDITLLLTNVCRSCYDKIMPNPPNATESDENDG